ncbi:hypothetical protein [Nocardia donostiensis]|uniref:hypothetical protein n=1 Tax=Nocardia donostiensis TaxID=1538463 RepID=UPI00158DB483|nr:hypothetical protein [Nocardia donostiensis]
MALLRRHSTDPLSEPPEFAGGEVAPRSAHHVPYQFAYVGHVPNMLRRNVFST